MRLRPVSVPAWEIADTREVQPIPIMYDEDQELELAKVSSRVVVRRYTFDSDENGYRPQDALKHARAHLLDEIEKHPGDYNFLVNEGWSLRTLRKPHYEKRKRLSFILYLWRPRPPPSGVTRCRIEVRYEARPAVATRWSTGRPRSPPFIAVLEAGSKM